MTKPMIKIPVFPLPLVLFPGETLNLHIFEDRYREMVHYCVDKKIPFGITSYINNSISKVGCVSNIKKIHKIYDDGRMDIVCVGGDRFLVHGFDTSESFLQAAVTYFHDHEEEDDLGRIRETIRPMLHEVVSLLEQESVTIMIPTEPIHSFRIVHMVGFELAQKQNLLEIKSERERLEFIKEHLEQVLPKYKALENVKRRIKSNGHFRNYPPIDFKI